VSLATLLQRVVDILDESRVAYMLTGSLAAAYYATPRATKDIDLVVETDQGGIERLVAGLHAAGLYVDRGAALEALRTHGQFNAIDPGSGWKIDMIVRKERPFSRTEFARRERAVILGTEVSLARLEDVLIAKLEWSSLGDSELQRRDVSQLLERAGDRLDLAYLERWVAQLGLTSEWRKLRGGEPKG
jgi:hypothetical protein